jgi:hypothetical protein
MAMMLGAGKSPVWSSAMANGNDDEHRDQRSHRRQRGQRSNRSWGLRGFVFEGVILRCFGKLGNRGGLSAGCEALGDAGEGKLVRARQIMRRL